MACPVRPARSGLPGASLPGAGLPGASLPGASLPGASLPGASLPGASLPGASLPAVGPRGASPPGASLPGADLPWVGGSLAVLARSQLGRRDTRRPAPGQPGQFVVQPDRGPGPVAPPPVGAGADHVGTIDDEGEVRLRDTGAVACSHRNLLSGVLASWTDDDSGVLDLLDRR